MTGSDRYDGRERDSDGKSMKRDDADMQNVEVRNPENVFREISFDSKPILEVVCFEDLHLQVDVCSGKHAKESGSR